MDLLERFVDGDDDAFEALFRRHQGEVCRWIERLVRDHAAAEDLTVETFWRVYRHRARFDVRLPFEPWARRIATRLAIDYLRSATYPDELTELPGRALEPDPFRRAAIRRAFLKLPTRLRAAATLALIEELPYEVIADALGVSVSAVKMRVSRAVRKLRRTLESMGIYP